MNPLRRKRLMIILAIMAGVGIAVALALSALQQNINLFYTPTQITNGEAPVDTRIRAGGMVALGKLNADGVVVADEVLAKHDEKYMPPEVTKALKESGQSAPTPAKEG